MTKLFKNISQIATLENAHAKNGRHILSSDLDIITNGAIITTGDEIKWTGRSDAIPSSYDHFDEVIDCANKIFLPELVDSHTHLIFGGDRACEYSMRLDGADYQEIANAGGGILNTVKGTNSLSEEDLFSLCVSRIERIYSYGVGTIEIKSGYGLNFDKERELSLLIDRLKKYFFPRVQIFNTYMAAHAIPKNYHSSTEYMDNVVIPLLHELAPLDIIDAVDIFHENGYFNENDVIKLFQHATSLNLKLKAHVDEFADNGGAELAAKNNALSCDHLLRTGPQGIKALSQSPTVATLLPGTGFFLGKPQANGRALLDAGCKVAIASDYNPGSCHCDNLLLVASLGAPQYQMNLGELICAITLNAAHSLGLKSQGAIIPGLKARFSIFSLTRIEELLYNWGRNFSINQ